MDSISTMRSLVVNPPWSEVGATSAIVAGAPTRYRVNDYTSPFSLKTVLSGEARYRVEGRDCMVNPRQMLIVNAGQSYDMSIDSEDVTRTMCLFLQHGALTQAMSSISASAESQIESPEPASPVDVEFPAHTLPKDPTLALYLENLHAALMQDSETSIQEGWSYELALVMARLRRRVVELDDSIPAIKPSTRRELRHRLCSAQDFLLANLTTPLTVADIAEAAHLEPHYFHRIYKAAFGTTPMATLREARFLRARDLFLGTKLPIVDVAQSVGYRSLGSFASGFRRRFGATPAQLRRMVRG